MTYFNNISVIEWCLISALALVVIYQCYFYIRYIGAVWRKARGEKAKGNRAICEEAKGVSVIICARNEGENLESYLQSVLTQDYPTFEVIVVNDSSEDNSQEVIEQYALANPRVRMTFVPLGARVGSTKKLALTLGAKAAQYDYLLLTDADCRAYNSHWISAMMSGFEQDENIEVVLGYGAYFIEKNWLNRLIQYDTLFNGLHYLGAAVTGHPYMGVGRNLAYRKATFFNHGGFSSLMTKCAGDDDLLVNQIATSRNTAVVVGEDSLTWSVPEQSWTAWKQQKRRHLSVSPAYRANTKWHLVIEPCSRAILYGLLIAMGCTCSKLVMAIAGGLFLIRLITQYITLNLGARTLGQPRVGADLLIHDICVPVITLVLLCHRPKKNQVW